MNHLRVITFQALEEERNRLRVNIGVSILGLGLIGILAYLARTRRRSRNEE